MITLILALGLCLGFQEAESPQPPAQAEKGQEQPAKPERPQTQPEGTIPAGQDPAVRDGILQPDWGGFRIAGGEFGTLNISAIAYVRYLNQTQLDDTHTDSFGRTREIDQRHDVMLQKAKVDFKGWIYDPGLYYYLYVWTSNSAQGQGAQVVVGGNLNYRVNDLVSLGGGITSLPGTRSLEGQFPRWLKVDSRPIADEFFRGAYTTGFWARGTPVPGLDYRVMIANNLSTLGVDAIQLDDRMDTVSAALVWMPTTGEFGGGGFGDFEHHEELATRIGVHATHSTEERQSQPGEEDPDNTQIRLTDGTLIFDFDALAPGTQVESVRYQMVSVDAALKYRGFALEAEYFLRWLTDFKTNGDVPFSHFFDHGFQVQASAMLYPKRLQLYVTGSKIFGDLADPWDVSLGMNWFPFDKVGFERQFRINLEAMYVKDSPTGNSSVPYVVGADGPIFLFVTELWF